MIDPRRAGFKDANPDEDGRIEVKGGDVHNLADELEVRLDGKGVFQRGGYLVEIGKVLKNNKKENIERDKDAYVIVALTVTRLCDIATSIAGWKKWDARKNDFKSIDCPRAVADTLLSRSTSKLPVLVAVLGAPTMTPEGRIINSPGFDAESGVFLHTSEWKKIK